MGKRVLQYRTVALFPGCAPGEWKDAKGDFVSSGIMEYRIKPEPEPVEQHEFDYTRTMFTYEGTHGPLIAIKAPDGRTFNPADYDVMLTLTRRFEPGYYRWTDVEPGEPGDVHYLEEAPITPGCWERVEVKPV